MPMRNTLILLGSLAAILLFLLATASGNSTVIGNYYSWLLALNILMAAGLVALVVTRVLRLRQQVRERQFGSRLAWRLTLMFAMVAVLPGALVYTLSVQFLTKSIETWFDVRVDNALDSGLNLGSKALDNSLDDLMQKAHVMAGELSGEVNSGARAFYAAHGAVELGRRRRYYRDGSDALVLELPLHLSLGGEEDRG